jgi:Type III secretion system, cytoplasmic E component of needle
MANEATGSELEKKLKADATGKERDAILSRLEGEAGKVKQVMDSGVSPQEFAALETQFKGLQAGIKVAGTVWNHYHAG